MKLFLSYLFIIKIFSCLSFEEISLIKGIFQSLSSPISFRVCANGEGSYCSCNGIVYYGRKHNPPGTLTSLEELVSTPYKQLSVSGGVNCTNDMMNGDPIFGTFKYCYCLENITNDMVSAPTIQPVSPTISSETISITTLTGNSSIFQSLSSPISFRVCANGEGSYCSCNGIVYYGRKHNPPGTLTSLEELVSTPYKQLSVSGGVNCTNDMMNEDPIYGTFKYCYCLENITNDVVSDLSSNGVQNEGSDEEGKVLLNDTIPTIFISNSPVSITITRITDNDLINLDDIPNNNNITIIKKSQPSIFTLNSNSFIPIIKST